MEPFLRNIQLYHINNLCLLMIRTTISILKRLCKLIPDYFFHNLPITLPKLQIQDRQLPSLIIIKVSGFMIHKPYTLSFFSVISILINQHLYAPCEYYYLPILYVLPQSCRT